MAKRTARSVRKAQQEVTAETAPFLAYGISGISRYGAVSRVYEEFLRELQGPAGMKLLREQLDNCPITGALMFAVKYLARGCTFRIEPAANVAGVEEGKAKQFAERIKATLFDDLDVTWPDLLSSHISMAGFGWSMHEMVFKRCLGRTPPRSIDSATGMPRDGSALIPAPLGSQASGAAGQGMSTDRFAPSKFSDGWIGFRSLTGLSQETLHNWEWDDESHARVMQQMAPPDYKLRRIPMAKALHFRTETAKGNPEGRSLLRNSVPSYIYKKNLQNIEAIGAERDLIGYPVLTTIEPDNAKGIKSVDLWNTKSSEAVALLSKAEQMVRTIRRDEQEGAVLPYWLKFSLVTSGAKRAFDINQIIIRHEQRIAMSMLADFIMLGHEAVGSKALASTKSALFTSALNTILDSICATYNRFAIPLLLDLNGVPEAYAPTMAHSDVENIPLDALGDYVQKLSGAGMPLFPDAELEEALRDIARLPTTGVKSDAERMLDSSDANDGDLNEQTADPQARQQAQGEGGAPTMAPHPATNPKTSKRARVLIERGRNGRIRKFTKL